MTHAKTRIAAQHQPKRGEKGKNGKKKKAKITVSTNRGCHRNRGDNSLQNTHSSATSTKKGGKNQVTNSTNRGCRPDKVDETRQNTPL